MAATPAHVLASEFAREVRAGLSQLGQKELPSRFLYDDVGSALFEAITLLPEYGLTRADERILKLHAADIVGHLPRRLIISELGSGSGRKTRWILQELAGRAPVMYYPIDVSRLALARCRLELSEIGSIGVVGLERTYLEGLREVSRRRRTGESLLVLFLGSTIGNFERRAAAEFLASLRECLKVGDGLLLGTDLVKPVADLVSAYDDPSGVTAAFNLNLLARANRELGADFDLRCFRHQARYNAALRRIEMHLVSTKRQSVRIPAAAMTAAFEPGESIWTEACHKFHPAQVREMAGRAGFRAVGQWIDTEWPFAENLWIAARRKTAP